MTLARLDRVSKVYGARGARQVALRDVDLVVDRGEMVAVRGPSGSGKSTLLYILGALDRPTSGRYLLDGADVSTLGPRDRALVRRRRIGFVFQSFHLLADATALENVELPLVYAAVPAGERRRRALEALASVDLGALAARRPAEMSGGQRQRVAVARALVGRPSLLLADEPTGNLDSRAAADVLGLFRELHARGLTVVLVTHDEAVARACGRQILVRDGRVESS